MNIKMTEVAIDLSCIFLSTRKIYAFVESGNDVSLKNFTFKLSFTAKLLMKYSKFKVNSFPWTEGLSNDISWLNELFEWFYLIINISTMKKLWWRYFIRSHKSTSAMTANSNIISISIIQCQQMNRLWIKHYAIYWNTVFPCLKKGFKKHSNFCLHYIFIWTKNVVPQFACYGTKCLSKCILWMIIHVRL